MLSTVGRTRFAPGTRLLRSVGGVVLAAVLSAGVASAATSSRTATPNQGITARSIKIGIFGPFSGPSSVYGKGEQMEIAIYKYQNDHGGINGRKIDLDIADGRCDASTIQGLVRRYVQQDRVFMIDGGGCSNAILAAKPLIEKLGVPYLVGNAASGLISKPPAKNIFHAKPTADEVGAAIARFVKSNPSIHNIGIVSQDDEFGESEAKPVVSALRGSPVRIAAQEKIAADAGDATALVQKLLSAKVDLVVLLAFPQADTVFLRDAYALGLRVPIVSGDSARPDEQLDRLGSREPLGQFFSAYSLTAAIDAAQFKKYAAILHKYFPHTEFDSIALGGAIPALMNIQVLKAMGKNLTWANWIKTAERAKGFATPMGGHMAFKKFRAGAARTRRPGISVNFAVLDPHGSGSDIGIVKNWAAWQKLSR